MSMPRVVLGLLATMVLVLGATVMSITLFADSEVIKNLVITSTSELLTTRIDLQRLEVDLLPAPSMGKANARIRVDGIPVATAFSVTASQQPPLSGTIAMHGTLDMQLQDRRLFARSLSGRGAVRVTDGRLFQVPLVTKVLGVLNIPNLLAGKIDLLADGLPFDGMTSTWSITNGLLETQDFLLKSPVLHASASGTFDLMSQQVDGIIAVSPFGAYTDLLKGIPLFGTILRGERRGLATALFEVKGLINEPQIRYMPLESITEGLKNMTNLPLDLLKNALPLQDGPEQGPQEKPGQVPQPGGAFLLGWNANHDSISHARHSHLDWQHHDLHGAKL